ncbi:hypothetical protein CDL12_26578 [Handroanthus impetiginosus]|uniref:Trichome birefringence-like C-terminal domain-containing protein n=1 Tax=Handroanthus impetiginosus TaxID=429701 RepID=A0A2G9G6I5_9LAMI|nr:hypothetical protein CDL12_26578 [Handroanthus impetiginosus]
MKDKTIAFIGDSLGRQQFQSLMSVVSGGEDKPEVGNVRWKYSLLNIMILNTGHHWSRGTLRANRWMMHANGKPVTDRKLAEMGNAKNYTLYSIARWLDSQILLHPQLEVFLRTISPGHFCNGDWNTGGSYESSNPVVKGAVRGTKLKILGITALSELRDESQIPRNSTKA